jgi:hypothetical protein
MYTVVNFLNFLNDSKLMRKVKAVTLHVKQALSGGRGITLLILDPRRWKGVCGQRQAPAGLLHGKRPGSCVGHEAGLDGSRKILPPHGFEHRTVHPLASRYTYYAIPPTKLARKLRVNLLRF